MPQCVLRAPRRTGSVTPMVIPIFDRNPTRRRAYALWTLFAVNCMVFLILQPHGKGEHIFRVGGEEIAAARSSAFTLRWAGIPCEIRQSEPLTFGEATTGRCNRDLQSTEPGALPPEVAAAEIYPDKAVFIAPAFSIFLHGSVWHLAGNLLFLWVFGNNIEDRLGPWLFVVFYLLAGLVATAVQYAFTSDSTIPVIGASGAVAGLMGAYLVFWPKAKILSFVPVLLFVVVEIPAFIVLLVWFGLQFFTAPNAGIAWIAHVAGFGFGALVAFGWRFLRPSPPEAQSSLPEPTF